MIGFHHQFDRVLIVCGVRRIVDAATNRWSVALDNGWSMTMVDGRDAAARDLIVRSLELAAERCEDLTPLVYNRLFQVRPETRGLFRPKALRW